VAKVAPAPHRAVTRAVNRFSRSRLRAETRRAAVPLRVSVSLREVAV